jgi:C-methyltransferase-like protein/putative zinc binding protein/methyltransferase family protein
MKWHKNTRCRYCGSTRLTQFLSLGMHPPSDSFLAAEQVPAEQRFPLDVYLCEGCSLVQLLDVVAAEDIFDDYVYLASSSRALKDHYARLVAVVTERLGLEAGDVAVDIGCNDGVLLAGYSHPGLICVGVEPSKVADVATAAGFEVIRGFFGRETAGRVVDRFGRAKVATATNVFPHVDDIGRFVEGLDTLLDVDGVFIIEAPYLIDLIELTLFDTIYHEHLCYLSLTPMVPFLAGYGLEVFDVERVDFGASGPAIRVWVQRVGASRPVKPSVEQLLAQEERWGVRRIDRYLGYAQKVEGIKLALARLIGTTRSAGHRLGGYGAPAKGNTLLNYMGLTSDEIECIAETNPLKQGKLTPGSHIPVVSEDEFLRRMPPYALLLSWNYLNFFLEKSPYIQRGGKFVVPIPEPRIVP